MREVLRNTTLADRMLFVFLIAASIAGIFYSREAMSHSTDVVVEIDGKPAYTFSLLTDAEFAVDGPYGETRIEIKDKKVRVREAHCPNHLCEKQGWVEKGVIVCLPNRIVVLVGGGRDSRLKDIDAVTG